MPSGRGRQAFRGRKNVISMLAEQCGIARSRMSVKPRLIDAFRCAPSQAFYDPRSPTLEERIDKKKKQEYIRQHQTVKEIIFPEDRLYPALYKRLPILQLEVAANPHLSFGIGQGNRPLLAQRIVRRQQQYIDSGMSESDAWVETRNDFDRELAAFRHVVRGDDYKEELSAYLTANVGTLSVKHQEWVETLASKLTGRRFETVRFTTREADGLPTVRELLDKAIPKVYDDNLPSVDSELELNPLAQLVAKQDSRRYIPEHERIAEMQQEQLRLQEEQQQQHQRTPTMKSNQTIS